MSENAPTTEEVRDYIRAADRVTAHMLSPDAPDAVEAFDRWMAAHDAEVRAESATGLWELRYPCPHWNPHRITLRKGCTACLAVGIKPVPVKQGRDDA